MNLFKKMKMRYAEQGGETRKNIQQQLTDMKRDDMKKGKTKLQEGGFN